MIHFELTMLDGPPLATDALARHADQWMRGACASGRLLAGLRMEVGRLGRLLVLRGFDDAGQRAAECDRMAAAPTSPGDAAIVTGCRREAYTQMPFLSPLAPIRGFPLYEIRRYELRADGLDPTIRAWEQAMKPAKAYTRHLLTCMYAAGNPPRIVHIWGFRSFEERMALRAAHYARGTWPPASAPQQIVRAWSALAVDAPSLKPA